MAQTTTNKTPIPFTLICLPFAGGNIYSYRQFEKAANPFFNLITIEYPGRGSRINESCMHNIHDLVKDAFGQINDKVGDGNYALYGHSMGGLIAYLLTTKLISHNYPPPAHLYISGTAGPSAPSRLEKAYHLLTKHKFLEKLKELGGLPEEILQHEELIDFFEPTLRADFKANETYVYEKKTPISVPMTVITGLDEKLLEEDVQLWQNESVSPIDFITLPGGHFFIYENAESMIQIMRNKIEKQNKIAI